MSLNVDRLKCRVRLKSSGSGKGDRAKPATPSLDFAQPEPLSPRPRQEAATDEARGEVEDLGTAIQKADPQKVADRVYELMQRELLDGRHRGGARR